jgi:hypothetical protein
MPINRNNIYDKMLRNIPVKQKKAAFGPLSFIIFN